MRWRGLSFGIAIATLCAIAGAGTAHASCGSEQCPIDISSPWEHSPFSFDLSQQYIDQDQPRAGTENTTVGAIPAPEDEVRTVNRITTGRALYRPSFGWSFAASLPYVSRYHEHIHNEEGLPPERQRWNYSGIGDLQASVTRFFRSQESQGPHYTLMAGFKAPTGITEVPSDNGDQPEPPARPGDGAWSFLTSAGVDLKTEVRMPGGAYGMMPIRLSAQGRANAKGTEEYRVGNEVQAHLGAEYPVTRAIQLGLSADARFREKDDVGLTDAERDNTGGTWTYLSPALRISAAGATAFYGGVQIPVYRRVNGIQLVSDVNLYGGLTRAF